MNNPFSVKTPEALKAEDIAKLFIDVFSDFPKLLDPEHTFLHGTRGTGKSMMLRYLEPHVQLAANKVTKARELNHYAVHMPIKRANYGLSELERLQGAPYWLLSEHILTIHAVIHILDSLMSLSNRDEELEDANSENWDKFSAGFRKLTEKAGCTSNPSANGRKGDQNSLIHLREIFEHEHQETLSYLRKLTFGKELFPYESALFGYIDFLLPFIQLVIKLNITPDGPVFLMLDDADNLPERMQKIVNSWVSYRTTDQLCLKISTQQRYKTWRTIQGTLIESPHDYSEIDINTVYTSKGFSNYYPQIKKIVEKRLDVQGFSNTSATDFFPKNPDQEEAFALIADRIKIKWKEDQGVSSRQQDDVTRYKVSEYMKELAKTKKTNTFSYSGFRSIVDVSSGIVRFFLEPASRMYNEVITTNQYANEEVKNIPHQIQDKVLTDWSKEFMLNHFYGLKKTEEGIVEIFKSRTSKSDCLRNLITSFGNLFQKKLLSDDTERRFISFMPTQNVDKETQEILDLAVEWGYLYRSSIGSKEGIGRNILYIFNRRLVPYFKLDPSGYAAYMSVTPEDLILAIHDPSSFVRRRFGNARKKSIVQGGNLFVNKDGEF